MPGWIVQTIVPKRRTVTVLVPLRRVPMLMPAPLTLCGALPVQRKRILSPRLTRMVFGEKKLSSTRTVRVAAKAGIARYAPVAASAAATRTAMSLRMVVWFPL